MQDVEKRWKIQFRYEARVKSSVDAIAMKLFNNCHKQRQRRGTVKCANITFYDRKPFKDNLETVFGKNTVTDSFRVTFNLRSYTVRCHIVFGVNPERKALVKQIAADCGPNNNSNPAKEVEDSNSQWSQQQQGQRKQLHQEHCQQQVQQQ